MAIVEQGPFDHVKVRATANVLGLKPGQEAEIDMTAVTRGLLRAGLLLLLRPINGQDIP